MKTVNVNRRLRRKRRISANIVGTKEKPRVVVFRSNRYIYAQAVDDIERHTIASASSQNSKDKSNKVGQAKAVGLKLGQLLKEKKVGAAVFDRSYYSYLGRVKSLCEGIREAGIKI